ITAIPKLLDKINIKNSVVTIDAMGTQTAIAEKIKSIGMVIRTYKGVSEKRYYISSLNPDIELFSRSLRGVGRSNALAA
ncbi:MAG: hypothetical protein K2I06_00735, partial [Ruminococcus sp.]|nr:hypothetical protein [Ruminococcus sp.]